MALETQTPDPGLASFRIETQDQLAVIKKSISTLQKAVSNLSGVCETVIEKVDEANTSIKASEKRIDSVMNLAKKTEENVDDLTDYASALSTLPREVEGLFYTLKRVDENVAKMGQNPPMST